jgi:hypothetical protein
MVSRVRLWSGSEVESRVTLSQVVMDDGCRRSATSARRTVMDPRRAKQQARRRAPRWLDLQRGRSNRQPLYRGRSDRQPLYRGQSDRQLWCSRAQRTLGQRTEGNPEEPEAPVVVRAWEPCGAQTRKELSGRADKPARWKRLQERWGSQWWKPGNPTHIKNLGQLDWASQ